MGEQRECGGRVRRQIEARRKEVAERAGKTNHRTVVAHVLSKSP